MRFLSLLALIPALALGQVRSSNGVPPTGGTFSGPVLAPSFTATVASGNNGLACQQNGCRFDFGAGASDYASSDGTTVTFAGPLAATSGTFSLATADNGVISTGATQTKGLVSTAITIPTNATFVATTGTLNNGTYYYRVSAVTVAGETLPSTETSLAVSAGPGANGVIVNWGSITGATSYKVYGRSTGAELLMATVTAPTTTWTDNGSVTPSGAMPTLGNSGGISTTSTVTARDITLTAPVGSVAIQLAGNKLCFGSGSTECWYTQSGRTIYAGELQVNSNYNGNSNSALILRGLDNDDANAVAVSVRNSPTLTTAGARLMTWAPDNSNTVKASIDKDGMLQFGIGNTGAAPTCDATQRGKIWLVNGGAGVTDIVTICEKSTADAYAWKTLSTGDIDAHAALTLTAIGSTPNANGASLSGQALTLQPADGTYGGVVSATTQTFAGQKTLTSPLTIAPTALGTCGSGANVEGTIVVVAGSGTAASKMCVCVYRPTGTVYAWVNALADHENGFGNSTTCPATEPP